MAHEIRLHAERAIILIHEAEASAPLRETDAVNAMELGARRMDFIGYKFQAAQEIADKYDLAYHQQNGSHNAGSLLYSVEDLYQDLFYGYGLLHDIYKKAWLQENRPYSLHNVMVRYDLNMQLWMQRRIRFNDAEAHFSRTHLLPRPEEIGLPPLNSRP